MPSNADSGTGNRSSVHIIPIFFTSLTPLRIKFVRIGSTLLIVHHFLFSLPVSAEVMYRKNAEKNSRGRVERPSIHLSVSRYHKISSNSYMINKDIVLSAQICLLQLLKLYADILPRKQPRTDIHWLANILRVRLKLGFKRYSKILRNRIHGCRIIELNIVLYVNRIEGWGGGKAARYGRC
jgi:hypothetical protein